MLQIISTVDGMPDLVVRSLYADKENPWGWELLEPVTVTLSNEETIFIPTGYVTDFASVPQALQCIVSRTGAHNLATLIHDFLYSSRYSVTDGRDQKADRLFADKEMYRWLRKSGVSKLKAWLMYESVRLSGAKRWRE